MHRRWVVSVAGALALSGCGGRSEHEVATSGAATGSATSGDGCGGENTLEARKVWERSHGLYGLANTQYFAFSPSGSELLVPNEQYAMLGHWLFSVADGASLGNVAPRVLDRDAAWSWELRIDDAAPRPVLSLIDLARDQALVELGDRGQIARLSPDGQFVLGWSGTSLERRRIADGQRRVIAISTEAPTSALDYHADYPPIVLSGASDRVAVATGGAALTVADFGRGTATTTALYEGDDVLLGATLAPSGRSLATVDGQGTLRLWHYPELVQYGPDIAVGVTRGFRNCYCTPRAFAPVAWSPDERYLATRDELGAAVVRRACDGSVVATLPAASSPARYPDERSGPAFLAFAPNGDGVAVLNVTDYFDGVVTYYALRE